MRHISVNSLWLQEKEVQRELDYGKIKGEENPSDGSTKHVRQVGGVVRHGGESGAQQGQSQEEAAAVRAMKTV